jgi:LCP family protein required for cell wall assembly
MKRFRWVLYALAVLVCLGVGVGLRIVSDAARSLTGGGNILEMYQGVSNPRGQFPGRDRINILIVGMDWNRDHYGQIHSQGSRADTIMILSADLNTGKLQALSVPRDTYVEAPDGESGKINGTFVRGGTKLLVQTLNSLLGVGIDYFVVVKPTAVREIVDAVGGVDVEAIDDMKYNDARGDLDIDIPKGRHHLNGKQAEGFVRFREVNRYKLEGRRIIRLRGVKGSKEEGDIRRTARQQQLVRALVRSGMQFSNFTQAPKIIEKGFGQIVTNLSRTQVLSLATIVRDAGANGMPSLTLPGSDAMRGGVYYYDLEEDRARAMVDWLIHGDEMAMRRLTRVQIRNGSGVPGCARKAADMLDSMGFQARAVGNAEKTKASSVVYRKAAFERSANEILSIVKASSVSKDPMPANDWEHEVEVVIGEDSIPTVCGDDPKS